MERALLRVTAEMVRGARYWEFDPESIVRVPIGNGLTEIRQLSHGELSVGVVECRQESGRTGSEE